MDNDFNTPQALAVIFDFINLTHKNIKDNRFVTGAKDLLSEWFQIFSLQIKTKGSLSLGEREIEELIKKRNQARKDKDFETADQIRQDLEKKDIILEDTKETTIWRKKI